MSLSAEYKRQFEWRSWAKIFAALPPLQGQLVLDLGCAVGDQSAELVARGALVIGIDINEELLVTARSRNLPNAEFRALDLETSTDLGVSADGIWCSFAAAYFPDLSTMLASWGNHLRPGGWAALTEIDDLFGHEPVSPRTRSLFDAYAREALTAGRYDFCMGRKLQRYLERTGFAVSRVLILDDQEFSFAGAASPEVLDAWRDRFQRMQLFRDFCGAEFVQVRDDFIECLARSDHHSTAKVYCCVATRQGAG